METSRTLQLTCHPRTPSPWVQQLEVRASRSADGMLHLNYVLKGALAHLRIPIPGITRRGERLWEHTCFEVFIGRPGEPGYHELNFSPSRAWAAQGFRAYREKQTGTLDVGPRLSSEILGDRLVLEVDIPLVSLSPTYRSAPLKLALAVVIEAEDGTPSYWALQHSPGKPDFHSPESFTLLLPTPTVNAGGQP